MQYFFLTLAFLLELVAFISFAFSPILLHIDKLIQVCLGIFLFLALIAFWSLFMAPKAPRKFKLLPYYVSKSIIYCISALVLFEDINSMVCIVFILLAAADEAFLFKHNVS